MGDFGSHSSTGCTNFIGVQVVLQWYEGQQKAHVQIIPLLSPLAYHPHQLDPRRFLADSGVICKLVCKIAERRRDGWRDRCQGRGEGIIEFIRRWRRLQRFICDYANTRAIYPDPGILVLLAVISKVHPALQSLVPLPARQRSPQPNAHRALVKWGSITEELIGILKFEISDNFILFSLIWGGFKNDRFY